MPRAVLAYDSVELLLDENGKPVTRWDGKTYKKHPVTGENVPDENAQAPTYKYINPRKAEWPQADFIVGNPPFIGNKRMRVALGDGYVEALRNAWSEIPESADLVMFWWHYAAEQTRAGQIQQFGFITTNSLRQSFNRKILENHLSAKNPISIVFAIPDHPWVDATDGADVRIAMTVANSKSSLGVVKEVKTETISESGEIEVSFHEVKGQIHADLHPGINLAGAKQLRAAEKLHSNGFMLAGSGFLIDESTANRYLASSPEEFRNRIRPYRNGRDLTQNPRGVWVIDAFGLSEAELREKIPVVFQHFSTHVKPERDLNRRDKMRLQWWIFGEPRQGLRAAMVGVSRYIATVETSKHRFFVFLDSEIAPDHKLNLIVDDDAYVLGVLSSSIHILWALVNGSTLEDRPVYLQTKCLRTFPFPIVNIEYQHKIRAIAEQLDSHRKKQQAQYPSVTITGMYNVLEKLKTGDALNAKEKIIHEQGLVSVLKQLHDELDLAVLAAYGWSELAPLMEVVNGNSPVQRISPAATREDIKRELEEALLEKLVALNSERAEDEKKGIIHWLRPEYQNPRGAVATNTIDEQTELAMDDETDAPIVINIEKQPWPKGDLEQVKAVADLIAASKSPMNLESVADCFSGKGQWKKRLPNILEMLVVVGKARADERGYVAV